ncbi:hypothetical protein [Microbulbifer halophilus]|uniref:Uncharacterized protein n=1 Tax=Microbulbifer halophilus TaxID=453963 RepID=A0ABW5EEY4_9GAMM|nr:hypothetical protein [Microbulbifer halophilus]MCW8126339.1 hypothetical protein [Microbulbifer halophilus]
MYIDLPSDIAAAEADKKIQAISVRLRDDPDLAPEIGGITAYAGFGGPRFVLWLTPMDPALSKGFMVLDVRERGRVDEVIQGPRSILAAEFPEVSAQVARIFLGPSDSTLQEAQAKGPDREVLYSTAAKIEAVLPGVPRVLDI